MAEYKNSVLTAATVQGRNATNTDYYTTDERGSQPRPLPYRECWPSVWETQQAKKVFRARTGTRGKSPRE